MGFFPLFIDLSGREVLIVGGGRIAQRKMKALMEFGASIKLVSPKATLEIRHLAFSGSIQYIKREYRTEDLKSVTLAVAATGKREVNREISRDAAVRSIPVNVVDDPELCTFFFPATVRRGDLVVGVTTSGSYPAFSSYARRKIEELFPESCGKMLEVLKADRQKVRREVEDPAQRKKILDELLQIAVCAESESGGPAISGKSDESVG